MQVLKQITEGVLVQQSECIQTNTTVVQGKAGVLLIDPGLTRAEMLAIAADLKTLGQPVVAGFSTHPDWDHVLWHAEFGVAPRYGTARGAAVIKELISQPGWEATTAEWLPPEIAEDVPLDALFGRIEAVPSGAIRVPWDGPDARIIEHSAHAPGHAALWIAERGVLVAGDMLSDVLVPMLDFGAADAIEDYLNGLRLLEEVADEVKFFIPGHGSVGTAEQVHTRIQRDREYLLALRDGRTANDPRIGPAAKPGWEWVNDVHAGQLQHFASSS